MASVKQIYENFMLENDGLEWCLLTVSLVHIGKHLFLEELFCHDKHARLFVLCV